MCRFSEPDVQDTELELPILVVRSFEVDVCVRGLHFFKNFPDVGTTLSVSPEDDPMSLVHDRYAIAVKTVDSRKIGHVPKFMSRFVFFFLRHGGTVQLEVAGPQSIHGILNRADCKSQQFTDSVLQTKRRLLSVRPI